MTSARHLEAVSEKPQGNTDYSRTPIVFQGIRVPRSEEEVSNPQLIEDRVARQEYDDLMARIDEETGQEPIPRIDVLTKEALGVQAMGIVEVVR